MDNVDETRSISGIRLRRLPSRLCEKHLLRTFNAGMSLEQPVVSTIMAKK